MAKVRQIIQLIETPEDNLNEGSLTALCDDGTVWFNYGDGWKMLNDQMPQNPLCMLLSTGGVKL
jgi:hypothetical protein